MILLFSLVLFVCFSILCLHEKIWNLYKYALCSLIYSYKYAMWEQIFVYIDATYVSLLSIQMNLLDAANAVSEQQIKLKNKYQSALFMSRMRKGSEAFNDNFAVNLPSFVFF